MTPRVGIDCVEADDALLACCTLRHVDHVDAHLLPVEGAFARTPEWWAREILENTAAAMRTRLRVGWTMLGLKLRLMDPDAVAGWPIAHNCVEYVQLQGDSRIGLTGQLVTRVTDDGVVFATFAQLGNPVVRTLWANVLPAHLSIVRSLLQGAAERAEL